MSDSLKEKKTKIAKGYVNAYVSGKSITQEDKTVLSNVLAEALYIKTAFKGNESGLQEYINARVKAYNQQSEKAEETHDHATVDKAEVGLRNFLSSVAVFKSLPAGSSDQLLLQAMVKQFNQGGFLYESEIDRTKFPTDINTNGKYPEEQVRLTGNRGQLQLNLTPSIQLQDPRQRTPEGIKAVPKVNSFG